MAEKLTYADAVQLYQGALLLRKGKLAKVREILVDNSGKLRVRVFDLKSQRASLVDFDTDEFKTPSKRIGYINMNRNACYVIRLPLRVYVVGLHYSNMEVRVPDNARYNDGMYGWKDTIRTLENPAILDAYNNEYPTLLEAIANAKEWGSSCAFDKQFAVSSEGWLYYKNKNVGEIVDMKPKFTPEYQYLQTLLDGNHEKHSATFGATPL